MSHGRRVVVDWFVTIVFAVLIVLGVKAWVVNPYRIPSPSMEPALHCARPEPGCEADRSDRILANRFIYHFRAPRRGEIVVFHAPKAAETACTGGIFVKRIIGMPGDVWAERKGYTYIDGKRLKEPYVMPDRRDSETKTLADIPPTGTLHRIPAGMYLMEGDNRAHSSDSRVFGPIDEKKLIGRAVLRVWPPQRVAFL